MSNTNFNFFADQKDILIKNLFGKIDGIEINNGDIKLNLENGVKLSSNFNCKINLKIKNIKRFNELLSNLKLKEI